MRDNGFTLLEVLVATVIGAFVAATAVGALQAITASRERIDANLSAMSELRFAAGLIRRDLENLYRDQQTQNIKITGTFTDNVETGGMLLTFKTVARAKARAGQPESDVYEVSYYLQQQEERTMLMRRLDPYPSVLDEEQGGILSVIAEDVIAFGVRFLDPELGEWAEEWPEEMQRELPRVVEVRLASRASDQPYIVKHSFLLNFPRWPEGQGGGQPGQGQQGGSANQQGGSNNRQGGNQRGG